MSCGGKAGSGSGSNGKGNGNGNGQGNGNGSGDKPTGSTVGSFSTVVKQFVIDYTVETMDPLMEHEVNGLDYRYVYGNERLSVNISPIPNGAGHVVESGTVGQQIRLYYHQDLRGTVDYLTSPVSQKVESWTHYNEWGEITHNAVLKMGQRELDLVKNYTGHDFDAVLNMYYAKARMYDAENRRFVSVDPILDGTKYDLSEYTTEAINFTAYVYGQDNPIRWIDPLGQNIADGDGDSGFGGGRDTTTNTKVQKNEYYVMSEIADVTPDGEVIVRPMATDPVRVEYVPVSGNNTPMADGKQEQLGCPGNHVDDILSDEFMEMTIVAIDRMIQYHDEQIAANNANLITLQETREALVQAKNFILYGRDTNSDIKAIVSIEVNHAASWENIELTADTIASIISFKVPLVGPGWVIAKDLFGNNGMDDLQSATEYAAGKTIGEIGGNLSKWGTGLSVGSTLNSIRIALNGSSNQNYLISVSSYTDFTKVLGIYEFTLDGELLYVNDQTIFTSQEAMAFGDLSTGIGRLTIFLGAGIANEDMPWYKIYEY